ncbi:somatostatin-1-like [Micropterus salmoides]|uniref:somatostatin-1-like n=1 Tax=Micropterus salmoides TaxID=27706 RepID=UPI0018ECE876|nr:somatostatin-1-like [Micropterus salmoides]
MLWCLTKKNSPNKKHTPKIVRMAHIMCILALLCFASCVAENTETEQGFKDHQLQQNSLSWLDKLQDNQELTKKQNLLDLLFKLSKSENGIILEGPAGTEKQEKNRRELGSGNTTHTRRPGCRVFFWKSWTAC